MPYDDTVYGLILNLIKNSTFIPMTIELLAYIMGLFAIYSGIVAMKEVTQEPGKKSIKPVIIRFLIAAALIALPRTIITVTKSMGNDDLTAMPQLERTRLMQGL